MDRLSPEIIRAIAEGAEAQTAWALAMLGGSVAIIVGTSYVSPTSRYWRLMYLLFIPAWVCLGVSIYYGNSIAKRNMAASLVDKSYLVEIMRLINSDFIRQQLWFAWAIGLFGLWLLLYLIWWMFIDDQNRGAL